MNDELALQAVEFRAAFEFADACAAIRMTAVVDDDYPMVRHRYEAALRTFLKALAANGRLA